MPRYRIREGSVLPHGGTVYEGGAFVELTRALAEDMAVSHAVEEVDASGKLVAPVPVDDLERFRAHERVGILQTRLAEAQARVEAITTRIAEEDARILDEIRARATKAKPELRPDSRPELKAEPVLKQEHKSQAVAATAETAAKE